MASARKSRRRKRRKGRLGLLLKLMCASAVVVALTIGATVFFRVEEIIVAGNSRYTQEEIIAITGIQQGDNLYRINKTVISNELRQSLPYIEGVNIRRNLPNAIVITVNECDAAASIAVPPPLPQKPAPDPDGEGEEEKEETPEEEKPAPKAATEPWLVSASGKLLEPAPADSKAIVVSGITPLDPVEGTMLKLPEEEEYKRTALVGILSALREQQRTERVSAIALQPTWMELRYDGRFTVRIPLNADFAYKLNVLEEVVKGTEKKHGPEAGGTIDLTRKDFDAVYSPEKG